MALPATGTTIRLYADVRVYFVGVMATPLNITMSAMGTYVGITAGSTVNLSASFGGR